MDRRLVRAVAVFASVILLWTGVALLELAGGSGAIVGRYSSKWAAGLVLYGVFLIISIGFLVMLFKKPQSLLGSFVSRLEKHGQILGPTRWALLFFLLVLQVWLVLGPLGDRLTAVPLRVFIFVVAALVGAALLPQSWGPLINRWVMALMLGCLVFVVGREINLVRDYPFKLTWSEGNRIWDYSLYFGQDRYRLTGELQFPGYMAPGRHGLWGLAFLIPGLKIWGARLWNAILWIAPNLLLGWVLQRKLLSTAPQRAKIVWVLWVFLFLAQGPIYAPLILSAVILALGYASKNRLRAALLVALACFYAGTSRWTWMAAPALWAGLWAVFDSNSSQAWWRRAVWPLALGVIGLAGGYVSQIAVDAIHPSEGPVFATSFSQALLWYRLLPSATNPLGILPGLVLAVGPLFIGLWWAWREGWIQVDGLESLALAGVLASTLVVGLVASVKIGGGNNLHNLDMFLASLVFATGILLRDAQWREAVPQGEWRGQLLMGLILCIPVWFNLHGGEPLHLPDQTTIDESLAQIQTYVEAAAEEGEVLFIDQRQLLTFGQVDVPLIEEYELKDLTNLAMIGDPVLFQDFYNDLREGRFSMIVTGHLPSEWRGRGHPFGEEDDAQLEFIYLPLQEYYQPILRLDQVGIWLLVPKDSVQSSLEEGVTTW